MEESFDIEKVKIFLVGADSGLARYMVDNVPIMGGDRDFVNACAV